LPIRFLKQLGSRLLGRHKKVRPPQGAANTHEGLPPREPHRSTAKAGVRQRPEHHRQDAHGQHGHAPHSGDSDSAALERRRHGRPHEAVEPDESRPAQVSRPWSVSDFAVPPEAGKARFHDFGLPDQLMHAIADAGFKYCTPIQAQVLPYVGESRNIAGQAQTGTGKTAAFLILMLARFLRKPGPSRRPGTPRGLILAPTRELVVQIVSDAEVLAKHSGIKTLGVYGGMDYNRQQQALEREQWDIIVATPGRLLDFKGRGRLDLGHVEVLVIDEADRMLDMGFIPDVRRIIRATPPRDRRQTLLFSATLTTEVMRLASEWMPDPLQVKVEPEQVAVDTVRQIVYALSSGEKFTVLWNLLAKPECSRVLVFSNRRVDCDRVGEALRQHGVQCEVLSGDVPQKKRLKVLEDFKAGLLRVVVATDVAGRGLHVADVSHVINFDLPYEPEAYVHRIGRTGRAGASGTAISFACENEAFAIPEIEKLLGEPLRCMQPEEELLHPLKRPASSRHAHAHQGPRRSDRHPHHRQGESHRGRPSGGHGGGPAHSEGSHAQA
jgi:ATP-dependent RNA helicase RhlB